MYDITPDKALIWLDFKNQISRDGIQIIKNYGNSIKEDLIPLPTATAANYTITSGVAEATNPSSDILRVTLTSGVGVAYKGINNLVVNNWYEITGECRSDGNVIPSLGLNGNYVNVGTTSTNWQSFRYVYKTNRTSLYFGTQNSTLQSGPKYTEWKNLSVVNYNTNNKCVIAGNGITSSTFPTQLSGQKGVRFDGGDHINCGLVNKLTITQPITIASCISNIGTGTPLSLAGTYNANTDTGNVVYINQTTELLYFTILQNPGNYSRNCWIPFTKSIYNNINTIICTYSGNGVADATGMNIYLNGKLITPTYSTNSTIPNITNSMPYYIGAVPNNSGTSTYQYIGNMYHSSLFPKCFSQLEVKHLHNLIMKSIKV